MCAQLGSATEAEFIIPRAGDITPVGIKYLGSITNYWTNVFTETLQFDTKDFINYDRVNNRLLVVINEVTVGYVDATGFHDGAP